MRVETTTRTKPLIEWLKTIAGEGRNGVLHVRMPDQVWRFYCLLSHIRAVSAKPGTLLEPIQSNPRGSLAPLFLSLIGNPTVQCSFAETREPPATDALVIEISLGELLIQTARSFSDFGAIRDLLIRSGERWVATPGSISGAGTGLLSPEEVLLLSRFDAPMTIEEILSLSPFETSQTLRHVFALYLLRLIDVAQGQRTQAAPASISRSASPSFPVKQESPSSPRDSTDWLTLKREIEERSYLVARGTYYDLLNVFPKSTEAEIKTAYYALAKKFHPDRYQASAPRDIHDRLMNLFRHLGEAYQTIVDPERRREYDQRAGLASAIPKGRGGSSGKVASKEVRAKECFAAGKRFADQQDFAKALPYLREAVKLQPEEVKFRVLFGRVLAKVPEYRREAEGHLLKAIELEPANAEHYVMLGLLYKEVQLPSRARKLFEQALAHHPAHAVALQELGRAPAKSKSKIALGKQFQKLFSKK